MMNMPAKKQYLQTLREEYLSADKKTKGRLLDEAQKRTKGNRKYLIRKLSVKQSYAPKIRKTRAPVYDHEVTAILAQVWQIYDYPCGQRLAPLLKTEVNRLRQFKEICCSDEIVKKLSKLSSSTIDRLLAPEKQLLSLKRYRKKSVHPLLYQKIPVKLTDDWNRDQIGNEQLDFVAHCGQSVHGQYVHTISLTDIASNWWNGRAILGKSQRETVKGMTYLVQQTPFKIIEIHPDNDLSFINNLLHQWCEDRKIAMSRSRPNHKNDNAWIEQKNYTHVRQTVGYVRYDTLTEVAMLNSLYRDLSLYKNFCQTGMKLIQKIRIGGHVKRKYDTPKTPCQRLLELGKLTKRQQQQLEQLYLSLNPAELKRTIEQKRDKLYQFYQQKMRSDNVDTSKKIKPHFGYFLRDTTKSISVT